MPKQLVYAPAVQIALRGLDPDGIRRLHAWIAYLERWDTDQAVRDNSVPLPGHEGVLVLRTTTDLRIFFRVDGDTITVLDVATTPTIYTSGGISIGGATHVQQSWMQKTN